eukprot:TRINITY_DN1613_c0_g1_i1.p1 TRINITY_DN1613_c0_g1~~TRINITY_DN1613_c0_g1_i1.p1  ORF type:complete len:365 (+),score=103.12 TRINITY_DN1613_c0_g1_i1:74-1096(+)
MERRSASRGVQLGAARAKRAAGAAELRARGAAAALRAARAQPAAQSEAQDSPEPAAAPAAQDGAPRTQAAAGQDDAASSTQPAAQAEAGGRGEGVLKELVGPKEADLPGTAGRVPAPPCCSAAGAIPFAYASLKTKTQLSGSDSGPPPGATWLWFLVCDMAVRREGEDAATVRITGSKFQAGWLAEQRLPAPRGLLREREGEMLRCVLNGTESKHGKARGGVPEGFAHEWAYSDSRWELPGLCSAAATSACRWKEEKGTDRWAVEVEMRWDGAEALKGGQYLLVADQRAEKLNRNQYATAMRGALFPADAPGSRAAALRALSRAHCGAGGGLDAWLSPKR